jgi:hypothetical protein
MRDLAVLTQATFSNSRHIAVHVTTIDQFTDDETRTACSLELVNISCAVRIYARK